MIGQEVPQSQGRVFLEVLALEGDYSLQEIVGVNLQ